MGNPDRKASYAQEVMLRVSWSVLNHPDGQPQHVRRGEVMLDLGLEASPDPELTSEEMQRVAFAAKMAVLKALARRPKPGNRLVRIGPREYESTDGRFHAKWHKRQGARSHYSVHDRQTGRVLRAFRVDELRETIDDLIKQESGRG